MNKRISFLSGIQRSGSTLITKVLNQHPDMFASNTSPLFDYLFFAVEKLHELSHTTEQYIYRNAIIQASIDGFYAHTGKLHVLDKHRAWATNYNNVHNDIIEHPRMILTMRPVEEVVASFHKILIANGTPQTVHEIYRDLLDEHITVLLSASQWKEHLFIVTYDNLTRDPTLTFHRMATYLGLSHHTYDFHHIEDRDPENDLRWGIKNLHTVRPSISVTSTPPQSIMTAAELTFFKKKTDLLYKAFQLI